MSKPPTPPPSYFHNLNRLNAEAKGIAMDHQEWDRSETFQLFGYVDRTRRADGFPVFIPCGVVA